MLMHPRTIARSFSAALNEAFMIDNSLDGLSKAVEQKCAYMLIDTITKTFTSPGVSGTIFDWWIGRKQYHHRARSSKLSKLVFEKQKSV
jgi:hypothetical protein